MRAKIFLLLNSCLLISGLPSQEARLDERRCGYEGCPKPTPDILNIHLVPHSHDDVGWLKTVDQYYFGGRNNIQFAGVNYIIDSVIQALLADPERKFIQVESAFFSKWWDDQNDELKEKVKMLVQEGRLEFDGGAWSMNDEATTHYHSIVDHFTWGLKFLNDTFGECARPRIGWQIDPFGHSREQASLFTQMGYDGIFFARLDYQDKSHRLETKTPEMIWKSSANLDNSEILTGALYNHYSAPGGFCFDIHCRDDPIIDDEQSTDYNLDNKVDDFISFARRQAANYPSNNIMITMGDDFQYMAASINFENMDKLIKGINARQKELNATIFYSTPTCYVKALHEANVEWTTKTDDFFPYASDIQSFWTGYFSSRPTSKRFERQGNNFLQICKQLSASTKKPEENFERNLVRLRNQMGVMQHHDALTGTEKQHVADDYHRELTAAILACGENTKSSLNQLTINKTGPTEDSVAPYEFEFNTCLNLNVSDCSVTENSQRLMVTVYNPLAHVTNQYVRFPVSGSSYEVRDHNNAVVQSQLVAIPSAVVDIHYRTNNARNELVFQATGVPPLGYQTYFVTRQSGNFKEEASHARNKRATEPVTIGNADLSITFDINGFLSEINVDGTTSQLSQNFYVYKGASGDNRASGAYIFRPMRDEPVELAGQEASITNVIRGTHVEEVHQQFNEWISQVVRVYKTEKFVEFEWLVGPIPIDDSIGREVVTRFSTSMNTNGEFFTDSNGREMLNRRRNFRDTFNIQLEEMISGNYYPINSKIAIEDSNYRLAVLNDRAQGGSSIFDGSVELMVHRRLLRDDGFGVGEALNETSYGQGLIARGKHWMIYGRKNNQSPSLEAQERLLQNRVLLSNWLFFDDISNKNDDFLSSAYVKQHSLIGKALPEHVYLMTFEPWNDNNFLIRFEHILEKDEDPQLSQPVSFNLADVFPGDIKFTEVTLAANQWFDTKADRLKFNYQGAKSVEQNEPKKLETQRYLDNLEITLRPMEMRTFIMGNSHGVRSQTFIKLLPFIALITTFLKYLHM